MSIKRSSLNSDKGDNEFNDKIKKEIDCFRVLINNVRPSSTVSFWRENIKKIPLLYDMALRLLSIQATSADAERYFSAVTRLSNKSQKSFN
ncbi:hypothetical protein BpHYR1_050450 [Brachionus plicatilis]|uniref:HAT C-terminal dimerisation domain-containing protein n=1 Tax=Brachionus plicatilis TaxID=10195 RepID=A0A3M7QPJ8_BRAPC|nr:hypothetical protein BpHYR1_050450 [Brachionus plicatilis]